MSEPRNKRKADTQNGQRKRANYIPSRNDIDGPGVWATCDKGREKNAVGELYDLFEAIAEELWPTSLSRSAEEETDELEDDLEKQILKEVEGLKKPRREKRFANCLTGTPCVVFISCKSPVDPVKLVLHHFESVERTGVTRTKHVLRLAPVSGSCVASTPEILVLAQKLIPPAFASLPEKADRSRGYRYRIELTIRYHDKIKKSELLPLLAAIVPSDARHVVDLEHPEVVIFVQILKRVCGIGIAQHYERFKRFNVVQVGEAARRKEDSPKALKDPSPPAARDTPSKAANYDSPETTNDTERLYQQMCN